MSNKSAGGVVLNSSNEVVLVQQEAGNWSFPKGHLEAGETEEQASLREIQEEAGITELEFVRKLGSYQRNSLVKPHEEKTITMFLYRADTAIVHSQAPDIVASKWANLDLVPELLSHPKDVEFFKGVRQIINASITTER